jgi:hypothetical protein
VSTEIDYSRLQNLDVMTRWTVDRQQVHTTDTSEYIAALAAIQAFLRSQHVEGDRWKAAVLRARRVEKHLKQLVKASQRAARAAEGLRTAYAEHTAMVTALPAARRDKAQNRALRRARRRQSVAALTARSLHETAATLGGAAETAGEAAASPAPSGTPEVRGIADLWRKEA